MKTALLVGVVALLLVAGVGLYVTDFTAYLGNNPSTCNNCHVMDNVYEGWYHAGHNEWTTCNDCHTPHALIPKYYVKAHVRLSSRLGFSVGEYPGRHPGQRISAQKSSRKTASAATKTPLTTWTGR